MKKILFFDGVCVMCNGLVGFALKHDKYNLFNFAPLQGKTAEERLLPAYRNDLTTVILVDETGTYLESDAIIRLLVGLGGLYRLAGILKIFPRFIRDAAYRYVARNRYRWFGKTESCALLSKEERTRVLE